MGTIDRLADRQEQVLGCEASRPYLESAPFLASQTVPGYRFASPPAGRNKCPSPMDWLLIPSGSAPPEQPSLSQCDHYPIAPLGEPSKRLGVASRVVIQLK